jgi:hypothetical protein
MHGRVVRRLLGVAATVATALSISLAGGSPAVAAGGISGAIFTTISDGSEVNFNHYADKADVYLDGGPGANAPVGAAGLPDGNYVFQVTSPSGKKLLSTDPAACRVFKVSGGVIVDVSPSDPSCAHNTAVNITTTPAGVTSITVQLIPYLDTPNPGGVYKAWVTPIEDYLCDLTLVDCGFKAGSNVHGFVPSDSKTDNFKVNSQPVTEIDTRFFDATTGAILDGRMITWTDTLGASNNKWSYFNAAIDVNHEAHVEAPEDGTHIISVANQTGCTVVGEIHVSNTATGSDYYTSTSGPQDVPIYISPSFNAGTVFVDVTCA